MEQHSIDKQLVYGDMGLTLIFMPRKAAEDQIQLWRALENADTWGEFLAQIPANWRQYMNDVVVDLQDDWENDDPEDQPFDPSDIPGYEDGDWLSPPTQVALDWMPAEIQERLGKVGTSMTGGDHLELDPEREVEIISALESHGYICTKDQKLIEQVYGQ
jgi:hypothetical protein